uniref:Uncharacterized protein n=1 Tax=Meloidogyne enterolobii TaxID=390850 RepID=A0A6V7WCZ9_MELEN|nr:unnamed protein product [Meloidogyne enterolobii]CAD2184859.1 unnamed protein product [Meloidogyne enterolobii]CAD2196917.1 unnamed protein product [Meloidogyne enterolobii]
MSNSFFVFLPSNIPDYPDNRPNKFRVHLPKPLYFSGNWVCGLHSINYPYSWAATIGTLDDQWIDIHFKDNLGMGRVLRVPVPKASHTSVEKLHEFLISTLQHQSETYGASPLEKPEDLVDLPSLKRPRNKRSLEELRQIRVGIIPKVDEVFIDYPDQYWNQIKILKDKLVEDSKSLDEFKLRTDQQQDETIKSEMTTTFWNLSYKRSALESRIRKLEEEAKRRDFEKNNSDVNIVVDFFETYPENYNEILIIDHLKLIALFIEDKRETPLQLEGFLPRFKKEIERMTKRVNLLDAAVLRRDKQKTVKQYNRDNYITHKGYVDKFFNDNPDYWPAIRSNFYGLIATYQEISNTKTLYDEETDEDRKKELNTKIDGLKRLVNYRMDRFRALEFEGIARDKETADEPYRPPPLPTYTDIHPPTTPPIPPTIPTQQTSSLKSLPSYTSPTKPVSQDQQEGDNSEQPPLPPVIIEPPKPTDISKPSPIPETTTPVQPSRPEPTTEDLSKLPVLPTPEETFSDPLWTEEMEQILTKILGRTPTRQARINYLPNMPALLRQYGRLKKDKVDASVQKQIIDSIEILYHKDFERFKVQFTHTSIKYLSFSPQLGYVLGFENTNMVQNREIAKYGCDLRGGFSSFAVYTKGLTENMIIGNSLSSLLRVVSVAGAKPGEYNENIYDSPIYARVLPKEVNEIEIEIRTMDNGRLVPFSFGTVLIVLIFKKVINF